MGLGHFTQLVWKATTKIGCAAVTCADGTLFTGYGDVSRLTLTCTLPVATRLIPSPRSSSASTSLLETSTSKETTVPLSLSRTSEKRSPRCFFARGNQGSSWSCPFICLLYGLCKVWVYSMHLCCIILPGSKVTAGQNEAGTAAKSAVFYRFPRLLDYEVALSLPHI